MTKVVFYKSGNTFWGFEEQGHTGFAESGEDILCSALSSMTMLIINAIEIAYASDVDYEIDAISGLIMAYYYQLNDLLEEYYDYLDVEVIEKKYEDKK